MEKAIFDSIKHVPFKHRPKIPDESLQKLYNLFFKDEFEEPITDIELYYYGVYYLHTQQPEEKVLQYFLTLIKKGNTEAMNSLAFYYWKKGDKENMIKYYVMAIEKGDIRAMKNLGKIYAMKLDTENEIKYYSMAAERGDDEAINRLKRYYSKDDNFKIFIEI